MDWTIRILQESKHSESSHFLTLTYHEDYLDYSPSGLPQLQREYDRNGRYVPGHLQKFFKRLRKENAKHTEKSIRYFAIGEYGETYQRPHYHAIIFNCAHPTIKQLDHLWPVGFTYLGTVQLASIHYVTGYLINRYCDYGDRNPPFALQSRKPGLGHQYIHTHGKWNRPTENETHWRNYTKINGFTNRLPRYYRDRIFSREEREWLNWTAAQEFDTQLEQTLQAIAKRTGLTDPHAYYMTGVQLKHDLIKVTKNKNL